MNYTFTEKKRIRKDFSKLPKVMDVPSLLAIQLDSYKQYLQADVPLKDKQPIGLHAAFNCIFPI